MNGENPPQDFITITDHFGGTHGIIPPTNTEKPKDHNVSPVGLADTRILTDYVPKFFPHTGSETWSKQSEKPEIQVFLLYASWR